jgi:hypothetical protein
MNRLLRPSSVIVLLALLVAGAAAWVYYSTRLPARPAPLPVADEDREIAWLSSATSATAWQRFVQAVVAVTGAEPGPETFPKLTTDVPEIAVPLEGQGGKLRIRWYKLTSEWDTKYWVEALVRRGPPPLAIVGGSTTDAATELARQLRAAAADLAESERPLLFLTQATADRVPGNGNLAAGTPLLDLYPGRTFRFCFSNRQMGEAVTKFIWAQDELRPDAFPVYAAEWKDDPYSGDLIRGFQKAIDPLLLRATASAAAADWGLAAGTAAAGGFPFTGLAIDEGKGPDSRSLRIYYIPWSVGGFDRPNRYEAEVAQRMLDELGGQSRPRHTLLVLSGQTGPSRRLVRAMCRLSPMRVRRFVLAAGDAIAFNTIVRDRNVTWPIQDLPCSLVLFCHNDPLAELKPGKPYDCLNGSEDLLLNQDIVEAVRLAATYSGRLCDNADQLRDGLWLVRKDGKRLALEGRGKELFDIDGSRKGGTGEHVVWLRPSFDGERARPQATVTVVAWQPEKGAWLPRGESLLLNYVGAPVTPHDAGVPR